VDFDGVADGKFAGVGFKLLGFDFANDTHCWIYRVLLLKSSCKSTEELVA
jgi:hypothetical protein